MAKYSTCSREKSKFKHNISSSVGWAIRENNPVFRGFVESNWEEHFSFVEFTYNNNYQSTIGMTPYKALYGRKCWTLICWEEIGDKRLTGPELVQITLENVRIIRDRMKAA